MVPPRYKGEDYRRRAKGPPSTRPDREENLNPLYPIRAHNWRGWACRDCIVSLNPASPCQQGCINQEDGGELGNSLTSFGACWNLIGCLHKHDDGCCHEKAWRLLCIFLYFRKLGYNHFYFSELHELYPSLCASGRVNSKAFGLRQI